MRLAVGRIRDTLDESINGGAEVPLRIRVEMRALADRADRQVGTNVGGIPIQNRIPVWFGRPGRVAILLQVLAGVEKLIV